MDAEFASYLERLRAHRAELDDAMRALDQALETPLGRGSLWRRRVRAALTELAHDLADHVALTESPGGLYADLKAHAPRLAAGVQQQLEEHAEFMAEVERLLAERDQGLDDESVVQHREAATALVGRLVRHRQRGSDLIYEAYEVDLGGSG